jgi:hypothetical protein
MDNRQGYGFRYAGARWGRDIAPIECIVATSEVFSVTGGTANVLLGPGDPVIKLATGGVTLCPGAETTAQTPFGVVMAVLPYWDAASGFMKPAECLPSAVAWGTNLERQSKVLVQPFETAYWEIDCDDAVSATTEAAYQAFIGENTEYRLNGGIVPTANPQNRAHPRLDISAHATTNTFNLRIVRVSHTKDNVDFTGNYVKMIVELNLGGTGGAAGLSTTSKGV